MSVMPVFWGGKACFFAHEKCKKMEKQYGQYYGGG